MLRVLGHWRASYRAGDRIYAYAKLHTKNVEGVKQSIRLLGACDIGVELPKFITGAADNSELRWALRVEGTAGDGVPDPDRGHCIPAFSYDEHNVHVVTWGAIRPMSWDFCRAYSGEAYAVLSVDLLRDGYAPIGLDLEQLKADLSRL